MFLFIKRNLGTIIVSLVLIVIVIFAVIAIIKRRRKGISSCGGECAGCAFAGSCHKKSRK